MSRRTATGCSATGEPVQHEPVRDVSQLRKRLTREEREGVVLDAARELFYAEGVHEVGMQALFLRAPSHRLLAGRPCDGCAQRSPDSEAVSMHVRMPSAQDPQKASHQPSLRVAGGCQHDCPDTCAWEIDVRNGRAVGLHPVSDHPYTQGVLCPKTTNYLERVYSSERLLSPLKRVGDPEQGTFVPVSWEHALEEIAERLDQIITDHGPTAVMPFSHQGSMGVLQERSLDRRFFARLGATRLRRNICGYVAAAGIEATYGPQTPMLPEQIVHSTLIVIWGTDTVTRNVHLWPFIQRARDRGARLIVIDPLKTPTARRADVHLRPRPGTDSALALGLIREIVDSGSVDQAYVSENTRGFSELCERAAPFTPEKVEAITGVPGEELVELAHVYAEARAPVIRLMLGLEKHAGGAATAQLIACLPAIVGAWSKLGGGLLHLTNWLHAEALNLDGLSMPELEDQSVRAVDWGRVGAALDGEVADPPIHALIVYNANPATTMPNVSRMLAGLARRDLFLVVHEQVMTDTARLADYVLPATTMIEHWDLLRSWGQDYLTLNQPAISPQGAAVSIPELFRRLATALGLNDDYLQTTDLELIETALDSEQPWLSGITLERLRAEGWARLKIDPLWRPFAEGSFGTSSGKCELFPEGWAERMPRVDDFTGVDEKAPLALIATKSNLRFLNSTYGERPRQANNPPFALEIGQNDAASRGIIDGDLVRVFNERGEVEVHARVRDLVCDGVVSLPHGWWASRSPKGFSANLLTSDGLSDVGGGSDFYDTRVEVQRIS